MTKKKKVKSLRVKLDKWCDKIDNWLKCVNLLRQALRFFDISRDKLAALLLFLKEKVKK